MVAILEVNELGENSPRSKHFFHDGIRNVDTPARFGKVQDKDFLNDRAEQGQ